MLGTEMRGRAINAGLADSSTSLAKTNGLWWHEIWQMKVRIKVAQSY
jgi:hypothetical protein